MRLPAEWEPQEAIWLSWLPKGKHWEHHKPDAIGQKWTEITSYISQTQRVNINAPASTHSHILRSLPQADLTQVYLYDHPNDDVWCRDHGAIFIEEQGAVIATDWRFNGWGGNFTPYELDDGIAEKMAHAAGVEHRRYEEVLEGGAIESNGAGILLTTEAVLLNPDRNPHLSKLDVEQMLKERLGVQETVWLKRGIQGDDTGGHIDDIARFVSTDTILLSSSQQGENKEILEENARLLKEQTPFTVLDLPMPEACLAPGWRLPTLPASYVNFLITNETVLVPTFQQKQNDEHALGMIREHFPQRQVIGIDCLDIVREGGALHCLSMQQPLS